MATIWEAVRSFRATLNTGGWGPPANDAQKLMAQRYLGAWDRIFGDWQKLADALVEQYQYASVPDAGKLYRMGRYKELLLRIQSELQDLARADAVTIDELRGRSIEKAIYDMKAAGAPPGIGGEYDDWDVRADRLRAQAVAGFTSEQSPLHGLLSKWGAQSAEQAKVAIVSGVIAGKGTDVIARDLRKAIGTSLWHAQTIARTEAHRAYREAGRVFVEYNHDLFKGWTWRAACDSKTCAICWERHGTFFPASVSKDAVTVSVPSFETHPNCRCALVPTPRSLADITGDKSITDVRSKDTGRERFKTMDRAQQLKVLGAKRLAYYDKGMPLREFYEMRASGRWGRTPRLFSLKEVEAAWQKRQQGPAPKPAKPTGPVAKPTGPVPAGVDIDAQRLLRDQYKDAKRSLERVRTESYHLESTIRDIERLRAIRRTGVVENIPSYYHLSYTDDYIAYTGKAPVPEYLSKVGRFKIYEASTLDEYDGLLNRLYDTYHQQQLGLNLTYYEQEMNRLKPGFLRLPIELKVEGTRPAGLREKACWDVMLGATRAYSEILAPYGYTLSSRWSGDVPIERTRTSNRAGFFGWGSEAELGVQIDVAMRKGGTYEKRQWAPYTGKRNPPTYYTYEEFLKVIIHEAGHSMEDMLPNEYTGAYGWEEGVVERAAQVFEEDVWRLAGFRAPGQPKSAGPGAGLRAGTAYKTYGSYTQEWDRVLRLLQGGGLDYDERRFYGTLLSMPAPQREGWVRLRLFDAGLDGIAVDNEIEHMNNVFKVRYT